MDVAKQKRYGWLVAIVFFFMWGFIFLDRLSISLTSEVIIENLKLTTLQFSSLSAVSTFTYAISAIVMGVVADKLGVRKKMLIPFIMIAGILSFACSFANGYTSLLILRGFVGFFEGPGLTLMMAIVVKTAFDGTFGRNAGIVMAGVAVLANTLGPIVVTQTVTAFSWQAIFMLTGALLILITIVTAVLIKEVSVDNAEQTDGGVKQKASLVDMLKNRNFVLCLLIGIFCMVGYWTTMIFAPMYLTENMGMSTTERGFISSIMGFIFIFLAIFIPALSDKIGRKPVMILAFLAAVLSPLSMWIWAGFGISVILYCIFGGFPGSMPTLYGNVIPMESLPDELKASAGGIIIGMGDLFGGAIWPLIASGVAASLGGIPAIMMFATILLLLCSILSAYLIETLPKKTEIDKISA